VVTPSVRATQPTPRGGILDWIAEHKLIVAGVGLGVIALLVYSQRKRIGMAFDYAKAGAFKVLLNTLPRYAPAAKYGDLILEESQVAGISPITTVELGMRESAWGDALSPPGPGGTGDGGHGRGLMQIDDRSNADWLAANDWTDPRTNVRKGLQILQGKLSFFAKRTPVRGLTDGNYVVLSTAQAERRGVTPGTYRDPRPLSGDALIQAAIAAYNTGEGNVLMSLAVGKSPDITTAAGSGAKTGNYSADVLARSAALEKKLTEVA